MEIDAAPVDVLTPHDSVQRNCSFGWGLFNAKMHPVTVCTFLKKAVSSFDTLTSEALLFAVKDMPTYFCNWKGGKKREESSSPFFSPIVLRSVYQ